MTQMSPPPPPQPPKPTGGANVVIAALVMAVVAVIILYIYIQSEKQKIAAKQFTIYLLARTVEPGQKINQKDWEAYKIPDTPEFRKAFEDLKAITNAKDLNTRMSNGDKYERRAVKGAIIAQQLFTPPADMADVKIEGDRIRMTLPVKSNLMPGGLRPGMAVDIAVPMQTGGTVPEVMLVLYNIRIKALGTYTLVEQQGTEAGRKIRSFNTVSVDVDRDVATKLSTLKMMIKNVGDFEIYIRDPNDNSLPPNERWEEGKINPKVLDLINKHLPRAAGG